MLFLNDVNDGVQRREEGNNLKLCVAVAGVAERVFRRCGAPVCKMGLINFTK